jgi:transcriptional regulator with XRE-family HTH domain
LAKKARLGGSDIAEIEGRKEPGSIAAFRKLADALGVSIDDMASAG